MKHLKYITIAFIGLLAAGCAEEDPIAFGALNPKVSVSQITDTSANVTVDLTDCAEIIPKNERYCYCKVLIDRTNRDSYYLSDPDFLIRSYENPEILNLVGTVSFRHLQPSTTYHIYIEISSVFGEWQPITFTSPDYTFTTAQ